MHEKLHGTLIKLPEPSECILRQTIFSDENVFPALQELASGAQRELLTLYHSDPEAAKPRELWGLKYAGIPKRSTQGKVGLISQNSKEE